MDDLPKELEENPLRFEVAIDPDMRCMTMKTHIDDESEPAELTTAEVVSKDPLHQQEEEVDFEKLGELDKLIYLERQRLLNLRPPKKYENCRKTKNVSSDWDGFEAETNQHRLSQKEKSRLRMRKLREKETIEEFEYRKFRSRVNTMKIRLLQKLRNFDNETYLNELNKRASNRVKQKRLELRANETPAQEALRKKQVNLARRRLLLRNKVFSTPEDLLREKEKRKKYSERTRSRQSKEQFTAKRKQAAEKAREKRKQNNREWKAVQKAIKGGIVEDVVAELIN